MSSLQHQMNQMMSVINAPTKICNLCGGGHSAQDCQEGNPFAQPEQVNFTNNYQRGQGNSFQRPYSQTYNPNWRNHPNYRGITMVMCSNNNRRDSSRSKCQMTCWQDICRRT